MGVVPSLPGLISSSCCSQAKLPLSAQLATGPRSPPVHVLPCLSARARRSSQCSCHPHICPVPGVCAQLCLPFGTFILYPCELPPSLHSDAPQWHFLQPRQTPCVEALYVLPLPELASSCAGPPTDSLSPLMPGHVSCLTLHLTHHYTPNATAGPQRCSVP